jgi:hypothetical protein
MSDIKVSKELDREIKQIKISYQEQEIDEYMSDEKSFQNLYQ